MLDDKEGVVVEGVVRTKEGDWQPWRSWLGLILSRGDKGAAKDLFK